MDSNVIELLNELPQPLAIVLAGNPNEPKRRGGMTAAWLSRVSWEPPMVVISIAPERHTYQLIKDYRCFTVNLVSKSLKDIALNVFGVLSGRDLDKFEAAGLKPISGRTVSAPIITNSPLIVECRLVNEISVGDHVMIVGEVVDAYKGSNEVPLIYYRDIVVAIK